MQSNVPATALAWSFARKLAFRFAFVFFLVYIFFNNSGALPYTEQLFEGYMRPFRRLVRWIGSRILHIPYEISIKQSGSGDTTYDYVALLLVVVLAGAGAMIWTAVHAKAKSYAVLHYWLKVVLRYYLAFTMFVYAFVKLLKLQFPFPDPWRLLQPYGESSPMGLAWTFMGYSNGYNYFTGVVEWLGAFLLLFRRTTPLGGAITLVVMVNVMAMNFCFDIPVKLFSTVLVSMTLFVLGNELHRMAACFTGRAVHASHNITLPGIGRNKRLYRTLVCSKVLLIAYVLVGDLVSNISMRRQYGDHAPKPALYGIYNVETFIRNNDTIPPMQTDSLRWKQFIVGGYGQYPFVFVKGMNDSLLSMAFQPDTVTKTIVMYPRRDTTYKNKLTWYFPDDDHLLLRGCWRGDSIQVNMKIYDLDHFQLVNRGFHWINEYPYNR